METLTQTDTNASAGAAPAAAAAPPQKAPPAPPGTATPEPSRRVDWGRVALFYGIAFGVALAITGVVLLLGGRFIGNTIAQLTVAFLYMPAPLVAGLVLEARAGRGFLITKVFKGFRKRLPRLALLGLGFWAFMLFGQLAVTFLLGNVAHIPGVGAAPTTQATFLQAVSTVLPAGVQLTTAQLAQMPPWWTIYLYVAFGGLFYGFTINALFAFGEEYGWRGVLQDELAPLGEFRANVLIGLLWGFWHAPLIVATGYNFPGQPVLGTLMMMVALVPFAFVAYQARRLTGSLFGPAIVHGLFNGMAGLFLFMLGRDALIAFPFGILGFALLTLLAWIMSRLPVKPLPLPGSDAYPQDRLPAEERAGAGAGGPAGSCRRGRRGRRGPRSREELTQP